MPPAWERPRRGAERISRLPRWAPRQGARIMGGRLRNSYVQTGMTATAIPVFQLVPERGIEPPTFSLRMSCSTD
jgi:hypothetical protein